MKTRPSMLAAALGAALFAAGTGCGSDGDSGSDGAGAGTAGGSSAGNSSGGSEAGKGGTTTIGGSGDGGGNGATPGAAGEAAGGAGECDQIAGWVDDYRAAHPGNAGDINALTPEQVAADPDAQRLLSLCGENQRPVIPLLAWEYGGSDHAWINPESSALVYCVYTPVDPSSDHWEYDASADNVTADIYVLCPDQNPCRDEPGADQVLACLGDETNAEILVDTASYNDGNDVGLDLSEASTDLYLVMPDGSEVHLLTNL